MPSQRERRQLERRGDGGADRAHGPQGPTGNTGATGPQGPTGADGVSGYEIVSASADIGPGQAAAGTILCPAGKHVLGGGWTDDASPPFGFGVVVLQSGPNADGTGWTGSIDNTNSSGGTVHVTLSLTCASVSTMAATASVQAKPSHRLRVRKLRRR